MYINIYVSTTDCVQSRYRTAYIHVYIRHVLEEIVFSGFLGGTLWGMAAGLNPLPPPALPTRFRVRSRAGVLIRARVGTPIYKYIYIYNTSKTRHNRAERIFAVFTIRHLVVHNIYTYIHNKRILYTYIHKRYVCYLYFVRVCVCV